MPYEKPPVIFVACEVRFPSEGSATAPSATDQRYLRDDWMALTMTVGLSIGRSRPLCSFHSGAYKCRRQ